MDNHVPFKHASDQNTEQQPRQQQQQHSALFTGTTVSNHQVPRSSSSSIPQTASSSGASPQFRVSSVAPINGAHAPSTAASSSSLFTTAPSSNPIILNTEAEPSYCKVYNLDNDSYRFMEQKVRQFYAVDGASFIEHVPGHCLVFIPNNTSVSYLLHELRRIRKPKSRVRPPKEKTGKPTNSFIKYRNYKIEELKKEYPDISQTEISRMAGEFWKLEGDDVKNQFQQMYLEEKRVYDMNKNKRPRIESRAASETDGLSDVASLASMRLTPSRSSAAPQVDSHLNGGTQGLGLNIGLGLGLDTSPLGFNPSRRRSHTLPPGGFTRSGAKRRISQELRKHLASKNTNAYMTANPAGSAYVDTMQHFGQSQHHQQQQQHMSPYEFTFTTPQMDTNSSPSVASPYINCDTASPLMMPINPSFPIAEFSSAAGSAVVNPAISHHHQPTRSLTEIAAPLTIDAAVFSADGNYEPVVSNPLGLTKSVTDPTISVSLPMIDTSNIGVYANDNMAVSAFSTGYVSADSSAWLMPQNFSALPDGSVPQQQPQPHNLYQNSLQDKHHM
ncbi:hypothetical protein GGI07_001291 [Coemansia sp. Benny D115]|nr:hypothetical protein GGI07_001291 [Coemansia sp. Benny D115]